MKKVAFICVHNSCRSQIAEALGKHLASDVFESYSAGTETKPQINQDAVRIMKQLYGIDMEQTQCSKLISEIPSPDIAISMGCNVRCPFIGREFDDNWGLEDPTGKTDEEFIKVMKEIETKIMQLKVNLCSESDSKVEKAAAYFENGFNCSQAVFTTFATDYGMSEDLALKVATQFGGGARKGSCVQESRRIYGFLYRKEWNGCMQGIAWI